MTKTFHISWIALRELFYERAFYIVISFAALTIGLSLMLGQLTYIQQEKLTLDFMLAAIEISMLLFSIFVGISLFQRELTMGSVSMILSKPIDRSQFLVGKYVGQMATQGLTLISMGLFTYLFFLTFYHKDMALILFQCLSLIFFEVCVVTAATYLFSVIAPSMTAGIMTICWFCVGHFRDTLAVNLSKTKNLGWILVRSIVPDLEVFNMKELAAYGLTISAENVGWAALYAAICVTFYLVIACLIFREKDIPT